MINELDLQPQDLLKSKIECGSMTLPNGRWYYGLTQKDDKRVYFPSVTSILNIVGKGEGFDRWLGNAVSYDDAMAYAMRKANTGSIVHAICMYLIWGQDIDLNDGWVDDKTGKKHILGDECSKRLMGFQTWLYEFEPKPIAWELSLYNPRKSKGKFLYPFSGQTDGVVEAKDGSLWLIDIKTGNEYKTHQLQLSAYKILWDSLYGNEYGKIDHVASLYLKDTWRKAPTYNLKEFEFVPSLWFGAYELWVWANSTAKSEPKPSFKKEYQTLFEGYKFINDERKNEDGNG
tara:strand:+ start:126 stop:989 length:864 start_codon:yes stop_codon:yes gene_type:complete